MSGALKAERRFSKGTKKSRGPTLCLSTHSPLLRRGISILRLAVNRPEFSGLAIHDLYL